MITCKTNLTRHEVQQLRCSLLSYDDKFKEFYVTKDNVRLCIQDGVDVLISRIRKGDKIAYSENFRSVAIVSGISEKMPRKYLKLFAEPGKDLQDILTVLFWEYRDEIYIKLKKYNPLVNFLTSKFGFRFYRPRENNEILLKREKNKYPAPKYTFDKDKELE